MVEKENSFYKEQFSILQRRLRGSIEEAKKEGDTKREIALLRVGCDVANILKGVNINYNPPGY